MLRSVRRWIESTREVLARIFFALMRAVGAVIGGSLMTSTVCAVVLLFVPNAAIVFAGPWALLFYNLLVLATLLAVGHVGKKTQAAIQNGDVVEATRLRAIIEGKGEPRSPAMRAMKRVGDAELLLDLEKWPEAAELFATIDVGLLPEIVRPGIVSELGYARAHAGDADRAAADLERAFALADATKDYPAGKRFHLVRRRGIALSLAGEHARAIELLAPLRDDFDGNAREWAEAFYFLGKSHAELDDPRAAGDAFITAVVGEGPFVGRAWKELEALCDPTELAEIREDLRKRRETN
jgi:tetratricopeptide (TPR) repeat protein